MPLPRRLFLKLAGAGALAGLPAAADQTEADLTAPDQAEAGQLEAIADLKPGDYTWHPERSPDGPVAIVASLPEQLLHIYRNGVRIAVSTVSSGKPGHETPTGVFVILQKDKHHHSSTYHNAPMPNSERLTWSGVALHAGGLPGYPSSHGCVHLPLDFSAKLFGITHIATPVIIAGSASDPWDLVHPGLILTADAESEFAQALAALKDMPEPQDWTEAEAQPVTSVVVSSADHRMLLLQDAEVIGEAPLTAPAGGFGSQVFVLQGATDDAAGLHWTAFSQTADPGAPPAQDPDALRDVTGSPAFTGLVRGLIHPGMILVLTDLPLAPDTRTGADFVILS